MVSPDGTDEPKCLNCSTNTACKTLSYPINHGFSSLCLHGKFYNISETLELFYQIDRETDINILCKECLLLNSEITLSCKSDKMYEMMLRDIIVKESTIRLSNIHIIFSNATLEQTLIQDFPYCSEKDNFQIQFEFSTLLCFEPGNCGLFLTIISAAKVIFIQSRLNNFRVYISISQLIFISHDTQINLPRININVTSSEYLRIPTIIEFDQVTVDRNRVDQDKKVKRNVETKTLVHFITFELTNPYVIIKESSFIGIHVDFQSKRHHFEPVSFSLLFEKSSIMNGYHVGEGGGLTIISEVQNSVVTILDGTFSNNTAVKGIGNLKGRGGGVYVSSKSLRLIMINTRFQGNKASDMGLALYTAEGVDVSITNCTFEDTVNQNAPIQQSMVFVSGKVIKLQGVFQVFNPMRVTNVGPIDVFYIGQGTNLNIETHCPKLYNHITEYSQTVPDMKYKCVPCSDNYYTVAGKSNTLSYDERENITRAEKSIGFQDMGTCVQCPYGALCTGNNVMPRPNYWGYWHEGELVFQQCPAGYCCSGSDSSTCNVYDYCPNNRTSTLCGTCQEGFSVSILTGACIPDNQCGGDQWFWLVAVLATMAYALWYTLKDDIFSFVFSLITFVKKICLQSKSKVEKAPYGIKSGNKKKLSVSSLNDNNASGNIFDDDIIPDMSNSQNDVDKGYFGIVTYYVQMAAVIKIQIEFSDVDKSEPFLDKMVDNIGQFLNLELTQMSFDVCPIAGLTTAGKYLYKLAFMFGIYMSWAGLFASATIAIKIMHKIRNIKLMSGKLELFQIKLIRGVVEIIKYTYAGICSIIFMSLVCAQVGNKYVWWYDGTNICLENWQIIIVVFALFYAVPFPLTLVMGLKLLKQNKISHRTFICSCLFPLIALHFMLIYSWLKKCFNPPKVGPIRRI